MTAGPPPASEEVGAGSGETSVAWRAWPLRRRPGRGAAAALVVVGSCWGVWVWSGSLALTALAIVVFVVSVGSFFVPTDYRLDRAGVTVDRPWRRRCRPWTDFRGIRHGGELVLLSPSRGRSWLDGIRGETLQLEGNREEVLDYVRKMVDPAEGPRAA